MKGDSHMDNEKIGKIVFGIFCGMLLGSLILSGLMVLYVNSL